jgi:hypothetical protein
LRARDGNRGAVIRKGADALWTDIGTARQRRTSQTESEGKHKAEGFHLTVSRFGCRPYSPFCYLLDNDLLFPDVCAKAGNGFENRRNYFVAPTLMKQSPEKPMNCGPVSRDGQ